MSCAMQQWIAADTLLTCLCGQQPILPMWTAAYHGNHTDGQPQVMHVRVLLPSYQRGPSVLQPGLDRSRPSRVVGQLQQVQQVRVVGQLQQVQQVRVPSPPRCWSSNLSPIKGVRVQEEVTPMRHNCKSAAGEGALGPPCSQLQQAQQVQVPSPPGYSCRDILQMQWLQGVAPMRDSCATNNSRSAAGRTTQCHCCGPDN
jgi:hypothetical protein